MQAIGFVTDELVQIKRRRHNQNYNPHSIAPNFRCWMFAPPINNKNKSVHYVIIHFHRGGHCAHAPPITPLLHRSRSFRICQRGEEEGKGRACMHAYVVVCGERERNERNRPSVCATTVRACVFRLSRNEERQERTQLLENRLVFCFVVF